MSAPRFCAAARSPHPTRSAHVGSSWRGFLPEPAHVGTFRGGQRGSDGEADGAELPAAGAGDDPGLVGVHGTRLRHNETHRLDYYGVLLARPSTVARVHRAVLEMAYEVGPAGLSMEGIAVRAGVGK